MNKKLDILVVGGGGREHAIVKKLSESPRAGRLYCAPGNAGIAALAECINVKATDLDGIVAAARERKCDLVFVAPDDPLAMGLVDRLEAAGIAAFGPRADAAIIESSKVFSKNLMKKYGIPTAEYETFSSSAEAIAYIERRNSYPTVVKADGLALGKGVIIAEDFEQAKAAVLEIMEEKAFGEAGGRIVVEEFLRGPEATVLAFTDGETVKPMVSSKDHKRAHDGDEGLNTGGMGAIAPNPFYTPEIAAECMERIFKPTIAAMNAEGRTFKGVIYFGLMLTPNGPKVIEYNARFGDPETQVVLPQLDTDFIDIIEAIREGRLAELDIKWKNISTACVVAASGGYPLAYKKGYVINGLEGSAEGGYIYHAGTAFDSEGRIVTGGGRVLAAEAEGKTLSEALDRAYELISGISFEGMFYRHDIGRTKDVLEAGKV